MIDEGNRWQEVEALFDALWELSPRQREARLDTHLDAGLAAEVRGLFVAADADDAWLTAGAAPRGPAPSATPAAATMDAGLRIGAWRIVGLIGRGGMGEVYRAERADGQFRKPVALKVARAEATLRPEQFDNERQILATLEHPGIARLIDGGIAADGRPYMVMELVEGLDLLGYCRSHEASLETRLALFVQVCAAVDFAHRRLVVHRDLKPGNILVTDDGAVKLLDFGIAKLLEAGSLGAEQTTALMTPEYAAPEQLEGRPVTTATDVYALGVLLYHLLAGVAPWNLRELPIPAALQRLLQSDPQPLAEAAGSHPDRPIAPALLRGDLSAIVAMALRREPEARYVSASALAADLQRHLAHQPVLARGNAGSYLARRFVRRHRVVVSAAAAVFCALVAGLAATTWQARVATREAVKAQTIKDFVVNILDANDPNDTQGKGETLTARQILDRAAARVGSELADQPAVQAEMASTIGDLYYDFGIYGPSLALLKRSATLHDRLDDPLALRAQAWVDVGVTERVVGDTAAASRSLEHALALARSARPGDSALTATTLVELGATFELASDYAAAERVLGQARAMSMRLSPTDPDAISGAVAGLGIVYRDESRLAEAETLLRSVLTRAERMHAGAHSSISNSRHELGVALLAEGRFAEAESQLRRALAMHAELLGRQHPHYAITLTTLAETLIADGRPEEAEPILREALGTRERVFGSQSVKVSPTWRVLALGALARAQFSEAERDARRALELKQVSLSAGHAEIGATALVLASALVAEGRDAEAEPLARQALSIAKAHMSGASLPTAQAEALLGRIAGDAGRYQEALERLDRAQRSARASVGDGHYLLAGWLVDKARFQQASGDTHAALDSLRTSLAIARAAYRPGHPAIADTLLPLGRLLVASAQRDAGQAALKEALDLRAAAFPAGDPRVVEARLATGA